MSLADIPARSTDGWDLCADCGDELAPDEDHGLCDFTALKSLASALSQGAPMICPRCGDDDPSTLNLDSPHGGAVQSQCHACEHRWGDGYPDSQDRPLPEGWGDCANCDGSGDVFGRTCSRCGGGGIVQSALLG